MEEQKLDRFIPSRETIVGVKRQLLNAGIPAENIPEDWLITIIAAQSKWQSQTSDGMTFVINSLQFQWTRGKDDQEYVYHDETGAYTIPSHRVYFFAGAAIAGKPINPQNLEISKKDHGQCDGCGASTHCLKDIRDKSNDRLEKLCNHCVSYSGSNTVRQEGGIKACQDCNVHNCCHHPYGIKRLA